MLKTSQQTRDSTLAYGKKPESLSQLDLNWYRVMTDRLVNGRTDRITIASTCLALRAVVRNDGQSKLQDMKMTDEITKHENAGHEITFWQIGDRQIRYFYSAYLIIITVFMVCS